MRKNLKFIGLFLLLIQPFWSLAQPPSTIPFKDRLGDSLLLIDIAEKPERQKQPPVLGNYFSAGAAINSNGWSVIFNFGFLFGNDDYGRNNRNRFFHSRNIELTLSEVKHAKEYTTNTSTGSPFGMGNSYSLGKINNVYLANLGYGYHYLLAGKPDDGAASIHWTNILGFSAGLAKPYYINLMNIGSVNYYEEDYQMDFVNPGMIEGKSPFATGLDEIKFIPGIYLKSGLVFDVAPNLKRIITLETGVSGAYYFKEIDQMVGQKSKSYFLNFYLSLQFGTKW